MRSDWKSRWAGIAAGLFAGLTVPVVWLSLFGGPFGPGSIGPILAVTAMLVTPGLLLINWIFCVTFRRRTERGGSRGSTLALGPLLGAPLGLVSVLVLPFCFVGPRVFEHLLDFDRAENLYFLITGVVSGGCAGFTTAWMASRPASDPS